MRVVVTTGRAERASHLAEARALAERLGLPLEPRRDRNAEQLAAETGAELLAVVAHDGLTLWRGETALRFSTGIAELRIKRVLRGEHDPLVALAGLQPGEAVLDCTFGLGRDSLVLAAAGARVDALESRPLLAAFGAAGLLRLTGPSAEGAGRIRLIAVGHAEFLAQAQSGSYPVVYLDPMFTEEVEMAANYQLFRELADPAPLTAEVVQQARRVASRVVIIKDSPRAQLLKGLGLPGLKLTRGHRVRFGVLEPL